MNLAEAKRRFKRGLPVWLTEDSGGTGLAHGVKQGYKEGHKFDNLSQVLAATKTGSGSNIRLLLSACTAEGHDESPSKSSRTTNDTLFPISGVASQPTHD